MFILLIFSIPVALLFFVFFCLPISLPPSFPFHPLSLPHASLENISFDVSSLAVLIVVIVVVVMTVENDIALKPTRRISFSNLFFSTLFFVFCWVFFAVPAFFCPLKPMSFSIALSSSIFFYFVMRL